MYVAVDILFLIANSVFIQDFQTPLLLKRRRSLDGRDGGG
jgi:hypothetical protein